MLGSSDTLAESETFQQEEDPHPDERRQVTVRARLDGQNSGGELHLARRHHPHHIRPQSDTWGTEAVRGFMSKEHDFRKERRGPVIKPPSTKTRITIRLDDDILEWFRDQADPAGGANYQSLINQALREYVGAQGEWLEDRIRSVVREELAAYGGSPGEKSAHDFDPS